MIELPAPGGSSRIMATPLRTWHFSSTHCARQCGSRRYWALIARSATPGWKLCRTCLHTRPTRSSPLMLRLVLPTSRRTGHLSVEGGRFAPPSSKRRLRSPQLQLCLDIPHISAQLALRAVATRSNKTALSYTISTPAWCVLFLNSVFIREDL